MLKIAICDNETLRAPSEPLLSLESQLSFPPFFRCRNSSLVNLSYVKHLRQTEILLHNETLLPVSSAYWERTKISFAKFIGTML
ncbi:LytTr DNA-binding domain [Desulfitobacterium hafniense]|uniref:LytTr DNA-binding domain n=1 Tax=Desulfitobacterium hafniense TaxID=49338 RepID=A0A098B9C6_DESHA|nr:LytTr DNA-binding domain [Desulfitobacterium hafniense]